jgi:hypothetical protein
MVASENWTENQRGATGESGEGRSEGGVTVTNDRARAPQARERARARFIGPWRGQARSLTRQSRQGAAASRSRQLNYLNQCRKGTMAYEKRPDDFGSRMQKADDFDASACTDPATSTYLAFRGTIEQPCPVCVTPNTIDVTRPTNRIPMRCIECGSEFILAFVLTPVVFDEDDWRGSCGR